MTDQTDLTARLIAAAGAARQSAEVCGITEGMSSLVDVFLGIADRFDEAVSAIRPCTCPTWKYDSACPRHGDAAPPPPQKEEPIDPLEEGDVPELYTRGWDDCIAALETAGVKATEIISEHTRSILRDTFNRHQDSPVPAPTVQEEQEIWFVESRPHGQFDGWYIQQETGMGGWLTTDPNKATRYTRQEAIAVSSALTYFGAPFRWSHWVATEHMFIPAAPAPRA